MFDLSELNGFNTSRNLSLKKKEAERMITSWAVCGCAHLKLQQICDWGSEFEANLVHIASFKTFQKA